jgi:acetyl-CoA hydrolase
MGSVYNYVDDYKSKVKSAAEAVRAIQSGHTVYIHSNAAAPQPLVDAMVARADELKAVKIVGLLTLGEADYVKPEYAESFRVHALFIGSNVRQAVNEGRADYTPIFLSEIPSLLLEGPMPIDVCLIQVSPPDAHGYCSMGVSVDCTLAARKRAKIVIAEVNRQMPRTHGRSFIHVSRIDHIVESDRPLPEFNCGEPTDIERKIGENVASLIDDGATLQMGIGAIPNAALSFLQSKKDLGIHTEMFSDGVVDLVQSGVITNDAKTVLPGKIAVSFAFGSKRLYDFVDNNPSVEFQTSDFINDPYVIAQNYKMTAINSALQVDITGQVSSDSIGQKLFSGFGGQVDFIRGASHAKGGRAIIALPATAKNGSVSRIVPILSPGAGVVTSRADVHYVITEYGIADLFGKCVRERAKALIEIAAPQFRASLEEECAKVPWLRSEMYCLQQN